MSRKIDKVKKRDAAKRRKQIRLARKKKQEERKRKKSREKRPHPAENLVAQLKEQAEPTFDKSSWQPGATASTPSDNTQHGSVRSAVLNRETSKVGFDKAAWSPPSGNTSEEPEETTEPATVGFNRAAWKPPDDDT